MPALEREPGLSAGTSLSLNRIARSAMSLSVGSALAQALMAAAFLLMSRHLGATKQGEFTSSFAAVGLTAILFNWGLDTWLLRSGSADRESIGTHLGNAMAIKAGLGVPWLAAVCLLLPALWPRVFSVRLVLVSGIAVWFEGLFNLLLVVYKATLRNSVSAALLVASRGGILLATLALIAAGIGEPIAYAWVRLAVQAALVLGVVLRLPLTPRPGPWHDALDTWKGAGPYAISDLFTAVYVQADTTIAAVVLGQTAVGVYAPAAAMVNALFVIPSALFFVVVPVLTRMLRERSAAVGRALVVVVIVFAAVGAVLAIATRVSAEALPRYILGESFAESGRLLALLSPIVLLKSPSFAFAAILVAAAGQGQRVYGQGLSAIGNFALNAGLARRFGGSGVAAVYGITETGLMLGDAALVGRWRRVPGRLPGD